MADLIDRRAASNLYAQGQRQAAPFDVTNDMCKVIGNIHDNPELLEGGDG